MNTTKYFVCNENTLCYQIEGDTMLGVLAGSVIRGGRSGPLAAPFHASPIDVLRPATQADFDLYRVSSKGHLA